MLNFLLNSPTVGKIAGLYQNSKGYWMFQPSMKGLAGKRPRAVSLGTQDFDLALAEVIRLRGVDFQNRGGGIAEWGAAYLVDRESGGHYRPKTLAQVRLTLRHLAEFTGPGKDPARVTRSDALDWFAALGEGRTLSTAHRYIRYARAFFTWLEERGAVASNPFARLRLPSPTQTRRDEFCTPEERDLLIGLASRDDLRFILHAGFFLGLRIGEIIAARWGWFKWADRGHLQGWATVKNAAGFETKTRRERQIPFNQRFAEFFASIEGQNDPAGFVLHPENPERETAALNYRWDPRRPWKKLTAEAGLPWVTFHTMRHTFGSLHAMAGTPELKIRRWMGITPATFERHYAGLMVTDPDADRI